VGSTSLDEAARRRRAATALGWIAGGSLGLLLNYALFFAVGPSYPTVPTTFAAFVLFAFGGMALADRLGERALRVLGPAAGVLFALFLGLVLLVTLSGP